MTRFDRERREVRSEDPSLSPETNRRLTSELRDAVGDAGAEIPRRRPGSERTPHATQSALGATLSANRSAILIAALVLLVIGAIVWVTTGSWWVMAGAVVLDLVAAGVFVATAMSMTTSVEHASPELSARLQEEGVGDPDAMMTELVQSYAGAGDHARARDVVRPGHNRRTVSPSEDPAQATQEQGSAMTPSAEPSAPAGPGDE
jgi:hypothetical protein